MAFLTVAWSGVCTLVPCTPSQRWDPADGLGALRFQYIWALEEPGLTVWWVSESWGSGGSHDVAYWDEQVPAFVAFPVLAAELGLALLLGGGLLLWAIRQERRERARGD